MSRLGALVAFTNTLSSMEVRRLNVLKFPPRTAFTVLSTLTNGEKNYNLQATCENLFEVSAIYRSRVTASFMPESYPVCCGMAEVTLTPDDIPGAVLSEPYERHTVSALRWWLLCRGIKPPTSSRKQELVDR